MDAADLWGTVVPTWLGAIGTVGASVVALVAWITSRSARGGVREIAQGLNGEADSGQPPQSITADSPPAAGVWAMEDHGNSAITFRNISGLPASLTDIRSEHPVTIRFELPLAVPAGASFNVIFHRVLGGPAVAGISLEWILDDGRRGMKTFYL